MRKPKPRSPAPAPLDAIHTSGASRQPRRPHYLAKLMKRGKNGEEVTRAMLVKELDVDKSQLSNWLREVNPSTPSPKWVKALGWYFALSQDPDDFVDIFTDPDLIRFQRLTKGMQPEDIDRMLTTLEAGYRAKRA
jgi:hypothetical protein